MLYHYYHYYHYHHYHYHHYYYYYPGAHEGAAASGTLYAASRADGLPRYRLPE